MSEKLALDFLFAPKELSKGAQLIHKAEKLVLAARIYLWYFLYFLKFTIHLPLAEPSFPPIPLVRGASLSSEQSRSWATFKNGLLQRDR